VGATETEDDHSIMSCSCRIYLLWDWAIWNWSCSGCWSVQRQEIKLEVKVVCTVFGVHRESGKSAKSS
jgi:hypothetical protein